MLTAFRAVAAWSVTLSLLAGAWLPLGTKWNAVDPDGICGPVLILEHFVQHFESTHPPVAGDHCVLCHWWNTMASASVSSIVHVAVPPAATLCVAGGPTHGPDVVVIGDAAPRAPPAVS